MSIPKIKYACGHTAESPGQLYDEIGITGFSQDRKNLLKQWAHTTGKSPERKQCWKCYLETEAKK